MKLFDRYRDFPPGLRGIGLDAEFDYDRRTDTFSAFEKCLKVFSSLVYKRYLSHFNINTGSEYLFLFNKQLPNILFKTILLEELVETRQEKIQIDCFDEELEFFDNESISRFASIFALIGRHIPDWFVVKNLGRFPNIAPPVKGSMPKNILLRMLNIQPAEIIQKVLYALNARHFNQTKPIILTRGHSGLFNEILPQLIKDFRLHAVHNTFDDIYAASELSQPLKRSDLKDVFDEAFQGFLATTLPNSNFSDAFRSIFLSLITRKVNRLLNSADPLSAAVQELKTKHRSSIFLCDGLYENPGIAIYNALKRHNITVVTTEHGLTAGISRLRQMMINYAEPRTTDVMLTYNESSSAVFKSSKNYDLVAVECGAPHETKHVRLHRAQRWLSRRVLGLTNVTIFYVSTNLLTNNNGFALPYPPDSIRYLMERALLQNVFPNIRKKIVYKYYPSENYLYSNHPYLDFLSGLPKITVAGNEDFRYLRTAADIIVTSSPTSTLGWAIGTKKPVVFLHSRKFDPLQDVETVSAFRECFFLFDTDEPDWESKLIEFLNQPIHHITDLWSQKLQSQTKYDNCMLLSKTRDAGRTGAAYIRQLAGL
jgi:hypothetical protein